MLTARTSSEKVTSRFFNNFAVIESGSLLFKDIALAKCVQTILELNWNQRFWDNKTKLNICHHMLTSSRQLQDRSWRRRKNENVYEMKKNKECTCKAFFVVKYANLWLFRFRRRRGCLSSLTNIWKPWDAWHVSNFLWASWLNDSNTTYVS